MKVRFGLSAKLFLLSSFLFTIPWFGYQYVWEMEKYLRFGQEQTLVGTARALATALHERPNLFNNQASFLPTVEQGKDLYGYQLTQAIRLDGINNDWPDFTKRAHYYGVNHQLQLNEHTKILTPEKLSIHFSATVGKYDKYLYMFFQVIDNKLIYRDKNARGIFQNDHLEIAFSDNQQNFARFVISNKKPGWLDAYQINNNENDIPTVASHIQGKWLETPQGYNIELRIPLTEVGDNIAFAIHDVDEPFTNPKTIVASADPSQAETLGTVLVPSPEIERIVKGMKYTNSSIWVVDQHHRVLARAGDIKKAGGVWQSSKSVNQSNRENNKSSSNIWQTFKNTVLHPLYYKVLTKPPSEFIDQLYDAGNLSGDHIDSALSGQAKSQWRLSTDQQAVVLSAAYPIFINNKVKGAVIVEETTNGIRTLRNRALEKLFSAILAIMLLGALAFIFFATRISSRIRTLSKQAELAIDQHGRITDSIPSSSANDEIGDLSRSFATAVNRLSQYNHYLENMSSRLSHELRTPIAVVRTSLDNLALQTQNSTSSAYIERAKTGIKTLNLILTNMSEATRIEQMLHSTEKVIFELPKVIQGCILGYKQVYPSIDFSFHFEENHRNSNQINGSPEHIVQLLDKVINNAVEFSQDNKITIRLENNKEFFELLISNHGPLLPKQLTESLFNSMISIRPNQKQSQPHLGLGLYIARLITEFHDGNISAYNLHTPAGEGEGKGVAIKIRFPI